MKHTKSKLISSIVTLLVCFAMLIGSTFAWFTDSASTGVNRIQAGTLDVQLLNGEGTTSIEGGSLSWHKADGSTDVLWEPGATYRTEGFKIKNNGNLDLKFKIAINGITSGGAELLSVIDFYLTTDPNATAGTSLGSLAAEYDLKAGQFWKGLDDSSDTVYLLGHMKEEAGNTYQGKTLEGVSITLYATQLNSEFDSFGKDYDEFSEYDVVTTGTSTTTIKNGQTNKLTAQVAPANDTSKATVVELPEDLQLATGEEATATLIVTASPVAVANTNFTVSDNNGAVGAIDLKLLVDGANISDFEGKEVVVTTYIAKNLTGVTVEYIGEGDAPEFVSYNEDTGELKFKTTHFSTFVIGSEDVAYLVRNNTAYPSLYDAIEQSVNDDCLILLKDWVYPTSNAQLVNITKSITVDGNGHTISGYGNRGGNNTTIAINNNGSNRVDVTLKNLKIINSANDGRPIETRGNINSLVLLNCDITASSSGNNQGVTVGGNQATSAILDVRNTKINVGSAGYPFIVFNPVNMNISNSEIVGYCGVFFKGQSSSAGSRNSNIDVINSTFDAPNIHSGIDNGFGVFVFEDDGINLDVENCYINSEMFGTANQAMVDFSSYSNRKEQSININIKGNNSLIGKIASVNSTDWEGKYSINIYGGKFTDDPTEYIDSDQYIASQSASGIWTVSKNND